jgi:hypothetical protein
MRPIFSRLFIAILITKFISVSNILSAQSGPNIIWQHAFGGIMDEYGWSVASDTFGNIYFAGSSATSNDGDLPPSCYQDSAFDQNPWIIKTDSLGNILWSKCYFFHFTWLIYNFATIKPSNIFF